MKSRTSRNISVNQLGPSPYITALPISHGAPRRARTSDPLINSQMLLPAELSEQKKKEECFSYSGISLIIRYNPSSFYCFLNIIEQVCSNPVINIIFNYINNKVLYFKHMSNDTHMIFLFYLYKQQKYEFFLE